MVRWTVGCSIAGDADAWCEPRRFVRRRTVCRSRGGPGCPRSGGRVGQERTGRALTAALVGDVVTADRESCCPATQNLGSVEVGVGRRRCAPARRCALALAGSALAVPVWAFARSGTRGWLAGPAPAGPSLRRTPDRFRFTSTMQDVERRNTKLNGQAARGWAGSVLIACRCWSSRSSRSARSVVVNFHLNGFAAWL